MIEIASPIFATSVHPETGQEIATGLLLEGTKILNGQEALSLAREYGLELVTVTVEDLSGFKGFERVLTSDLESAVAVAQNK